MYVDVPPVHDAVKVMVLPTFCVDGRVGFEVNVIVTDAVSETVNSVYSSTFTIDPALTHQTVQKRQM